MKPWIEVKTTFQILRKDPPGMVRVNSFLLGVVAGVLLCGIAVVLAPFLLETQQVKAELGQKARGNCSWDVPNAQGQPIRVTQPLSVVPIGLVTPQPIQLSLVKYGGTCRSSSPGVSHEVVVYTLGRISADGQTLDGNAKGTWLTAQDILVTFSPGTYTNHLEIRPVSRVNRLNYSGRHFPELAIPIATALRR